MDSRRSYWSELSEGSKKFYTKQGVTAPTYNVWMGMPQLERTQLTKTARAAGYDSGLKYLATRAEVRKSGGKPITIVTRPREAARRILKGASTRTVEGRQRYRMASRLFKAEEWDRLDWSEFMSP